MKNLKRIIALVAVFALALTTIASAATFSDVAEDSAYYEAVETLSKLGIIDGYTDGTFKPEQTVTRAEMAKLLATMQGYGETATSGSATKFSDVPATHWASGYIANATGVAINGYPDGTFGPDQNVTYEQAVKMIMATLGYTVIANSQGGYPMGYVSAAIKEGVTKNVSNATVGTEATRGTIAQLIYNAIDTPLVEQTTWEADGSGEYTKYDGSGNKAYKTLMSENLDVVKMKGVVLANPYMNLDEVVTYDKDDDTKVEITTTYFYNVTDNEFVDKDGDAKYTSYEFLVGDSDASDYIGMAVIYFAMENDYDEWEILSISEDTTYNKKVTFNISDYDEAKSGTDVVYYFKNGASTSTKLNLEKDSSSNVAVKVLYNNAYYNPSNVFTLMEDLKDELYSGQITLVDTNKTTGYDVIIVSAAASAVVDEINDGVIDLKAAAEFIDTSVDSIDAEDEDMVIKFFKDGEEVEVDAIAENNVVSIVYADNGVYMVVDVMSNVIEGTVSSKKNSDTSSNGKAYKIDGTWYDVAANVSVTADSGDVGQFYIDKYGKIAYFEKGSSAAGNYAFIMDTDLDNDNWGKQTYELKILTADGVKVYKAADTFTYNDTKTKVKDMSTEIAALKGAVADISFSGDYVKKITTNDFDTTGTLSGKYVAEDSRIGNTDLDADTIVFFIEMDGTDYKESDSYVGTLADIADGETVGSSCKYYATDDAKNDANIIVVTGLGTSITESAKIAVIVDVEDTTLADDSDAYALTMLYEGEEIEVTTTNDVYLKNTSLEIGDVVKVKVNSNKVVTGLEVAYEATETTVDRSNGKTVSVTAFAPAYSHANETFAAGYATSIVKDSKKLTLDGNEYRLNKFDNIYVIDNTGRDIEVKKGSAASYKFDDKLFSLGSKHIYIDSNDIGTEIEDVQDYIIIREYSFDGDTYREAVVIKGADYRLK